MKRLIILVAILISVFASSFSRDNKFLDGNNKILTEKRITTTFLNPKKFDFQKRLTLVPNLTMTKDKRALSSEPGSKYRKRKLRRYPPCLIIPIGVSIAKFIDEENITKYKTGFTFGAGIEIPMDTLGNLIGNVSLFYQPKGSEFKDSTILFDDYVGYNIYNAKQSNNYISLNLSLKKYIGKRQLFYLNAGLYGSYLVKATFKAEGYSAEEDTFEGFDFDNKSSYNSTDFGLNAGFGINTPLSPIDHSAYLFFEAQVNRSFFSILDSNSSVPEPNILNLSFVILGGIRFPIN